MSSGELTHSVDKAAKPHITCAACRNVISALQDDLGGRVPRKSPSPVVAQYLVPVLQISALDGCHLCSIISQALCPAHRRSDVLISSQSTVVVRIGHYTNDTALGFLSVKLLDSTGKKVDDASIAVVSKPSPGYPAHPLEASWSISTGSDAALNQAKDWLGCCLDAHLLCRQVAHIPVSSNEMPFPSYLVRVAKDSVQLCSTKDLNGRPHYLTLSYRWGETRTFTLTLRNMKDLLVNIVEDELPQTLRDAVHITRRLGYEFIWIDSLCIIQDSKEHWQTESAIMGDIYRGSVCTIAALGAKDCGTGCFTERNPLCFQHFIFEYGEGKTAYITPELETTSLYSTGYGSTVEPLHERAWVVQERMLSPRTLFFGTYDVHWECVEKEASTRQPEMISEVPSPKYALHKACSLEVTGKFDDSYKLFWKWWSRIITQYSPCGLTYRTDKLVALHGLLTLVESKTGLTNVAGLWKEYIFPELLWYVHRPTPRPPSGNEYQAPSWAWTSLNTEVNVGIKDLSYEFHWKIELLNVMANKASENGQLTGGYLHVRGPVTKVRWEDVGQVYKVRWGDRDKVFVWNTPDDGVSYLPDCLPEPDQDLMALLVVHATSENAWMYMGLVLEKSTDADTWIRVGSFRQYQWNGSETEFFQEGRFEVRDLMIL